MAVFLLLFTGHLLEFFKLRLYELHNRTQSLCLWKIDILRLSTLHIRNLIIDTASVSCKHGISNARPYSHQLR